MARIFKSEILQNYLNNKSFKEGQTFFERFIEVLRNFLKNFNKTLSGEVIQTDSELNNAIQSVVGLTQEADVDLDIETVDLLQSPSIIPDADQANILLLEEELGLRNEDGTRKRFLSTNFKKTHSKIAELNNDILSSAYRARKIKVLGEKVMLEYMKGFK